VATWRLNEDAAQPAVATLASGTPVTTGSFTPRAGQLVLALVVVDGPASTSATGTITDSTGGTWTLLKRSNVTGATAGGSCEIWSRYISTAPGAMTVSCACSPSAGGEVAIRILNGAAPVQNGLTAGNGGAAITPALSMAGTKLGSRVYGTIERWTSTTAATMNGNTTSINSFPNSGNGTWFGSFRGTNDTGDLTAVSFGSSDASSSWQIAAVEILPLVPQAMLVPDSQAIVRSYSW
jgi:hypothetical protein